MSSSSSSSSTSFNSSSSYSYYDILGVQPTATLQEIRDAYKQTVLKIHPDKVVSSATASKDGDGGGEGEVSTSNSNSSSVNLHLRKRGVEFFQVQDAWKTLSNASRRFLYDMRTFGCSQEFPESDESYLVDLERMQAERDLSVMGPQLQRIVRRETREGGIIILDAYFGDLSVVETFHLVYQEGSAPGGLGSAIPKPDNNNNNTSCNSKLSRHGEEGLYIDVRVAVQCLVDTREHNIIVPEGGSRAQVIRGFYDPTPFSLRGQTELGLFIRYKFGSIVHEVIYRDREEIIIPLSRHKLENVSQRLKQKLIEREKFEKGRREARRREIVDKGTVYGNLLVSGIFLSVLVLKEKEAISKMVGKAFGRLRSF